MNWKNIEGYEGLYEVSDTGTVRSMSRTVLNKHGNPQRYNEKVLKHDKYTMSNATYSRVTLCKDHITTRFLVHRLVATAFIPNTYNKEYVNHIDNDGQNNTVSNLEWCTHSENMEHAQKQGRLHNSQSKGGTAGGAVGKKKRLERLASLRGSKVGDWYVLDEPHTEKHSKVYMPCVCVCGTYQLVESSRLSRRETTNCRACGQTNKVKI